MKTVDVYSLIAHNVQNIAVNVNIGNDIIFYGFVRDRNETPLYDANQIGFIRMLMNLSTTKSAIFHLYTDIGDDADHAMEMLMAMLSEHSNDIQVNSNYSSYYDPEHKLMNMISSPLLYDIFMLGSNVVWVALNNQTKYPFHTRNLANLQNEILGYLTNHGA